VPLPSVTRSPAKAIVADGGRVLVVDDDRRMASGVAEWLCRQGHHASAAGSADEAIRLLGRGGFGACVLDGLLPEGGTARVARAVRTLSPRASVIVAVPSTTTLDPAVAPDSTIEAPLRDAELLAALAPGAVDRPGVRSMPSPPPLVGSSAALAQALDVAERVAPTPATVLITGESGTGKSRLARHLHAASGRCGRFVEVVCGSLSETLLESELFGHVAGAFTGATRDRPGRFLQADGGTIFLDEVATASPALQVKLLRVLQEMQFEPVGGGDTHRVDARVILATHEDLSALVAAGRFRADLFWRINVVAIDMPPLRQRLDDIPELACHFLARAADRAGRAVEGFTPEAMAALRAHAWPGNVRELEHAVERAVFLGRGTWIDLADLPPTVMAEAPAARGEDREATARSTGQPDGRPAAASLKRALAVPERQLILDALARNDWRRDAAARTLGINRATLYKKIKRLGMDLAALAPSRAAASAD
jgi:DNA-binding NtrC family response regulator